MIRGSHIDCEHLEKLSGKELSGLSIMLGIPKTGTKKKMIERILDCHEVRKKIGSYKLRDDQIGWREFLDREAAGEDMSFCFQADPSIEQMKADFPGKELKAMCRAVRCFAGGSKGQMVRSLLGWRNRCRGNGSRAYRQALEEVRNLPKPAQMRLAF